MSYESPITLLKANHITEEINKQTDEVIFKAVVNVLPQVNKEELIKALEYDRGQYAKGYKDRDAEIVRCKDCAWWAINNTGICLNHLMDTEENDFCSWAKMKGGAE